MQARRASRELALILFSQLDKNIEKRRLRINCFKIGKNAYFFFL